MRAVSLSLVLLVGVAARADSPQYPPPAEVKSAFLKLLDRPKVPADPKAIENRLDPDGLLTEKLTFASEKKADGTVERVPVLIVRPGSGGKRPAVIVLHGTGGSKDGVKPWLVDLAKRGFVAVAIDARRGRPRTTRRSSGRGRPGRMRNRSTRFITTPFGTSGGPWISSKRGPISIPKRSA